MDRGITDSNGRDSNQRMAERILSLDWAKTPMGERSSWPKSLTSTIKVLLGSKYPMILLWGEELIQIYNDAYTALIGDKHPYALGKSIKETQAESWAVIGPMIREVMSTGISNWVPEQLLAVNRTGFNEETYFSLSYSAVEDDHNTISGMLCVCSEITHQVVAERRLRIQRDLSAAASDVNSIEKVLEDIMAVARNYTTDLPFTMLYMLENEQLVCRGTTGVPAGEYTHAPWKLEKAMHGQIMVTDHVAQFMSLQGGLWNEPVQKSVTVPIPSAIPSRPLGVLVAGVNPNAPLDENYLSFYTLLAGQISVAVRNALAYEEERKRAAYLAEIDRAKTAFFNNISHEFRTPLTLILGPLRDILTHQATSHDRQTIEKVSVAYSNAVRLLKLVNTLLDFSRIEAHRMQATYTPVDLSQLTAQLASSFESAIKKENLFFQVTCTPLSDLIYVDMQMWEKIVFNILSNAFKFTFNGGISVRLQETAEDAILIISDTGVGIPADELPRIFDRFHRVTSSRSRTHEGTGIGLALTRELVTIHGGDITAVSQPDVGTTFTVRIPKGTAHLDAKLIRESNDEEATDFLLEGYTNEISSWVRKEGEAITTADTGRDLILVVDDNAQMADYIQTILSRHWKVVTASNGREALTLIYQNTPDLVLSDVMMPDINGFELLNVIKKDVKISDIPVILLSARAGKEATIEGLGKGANDYLIKPFYADELIARVSTQLQLRKAERANASLRERERNQRLFQEELERMVRERTADLIQINAELEQFAFAASHDLQEPLRKILLYSQMLENEISPDQQNTGRYLEKIMTSSARMRNLINDLLNFSRLSIKEVEFQSTDLNIILDNLLIDLELQINRSQAKISYANLPVIDAIPLQMQQLFFNLLSNALKFSDNKRTPVINVQASTAAPADIALLRTPDRSAEYLKIVITDNGIGFNQKYADQIFTMFQKLHHRSAYAGTGIGLALCKKVVINHHGIIYATSVEGAGSQFTIILPSRQSDVALSIGITSSAQQ